MTPRIQTSEPMQGDKPGMTAWQRERMGPLQAFNDNHAHMSWRQIVAACVMVAFFTIIIAGIPA